MFIYKGENIFIVYEYLYYSKGIFWDNIVMYIKYCCFGFNFLRNIKNVYIFLF